MNARERIEAILNRNVCDRPHSLRRFPMQPPKAADSWVFRFRTFILTVKKQQLLLPTRMSSWVLTV